MTRKQKLRDNRLQKAYDISADDYHIMFENQNGRCAICNKDFSFVIKNLNVDHDHITRKVRGLLCNKCNLGLGQFKDDPKLLLKAADYVKSYRVIRSL
jgi:hypothetical protein